MQTWPALEAASLRLLLGIPEFGGSKTKTAAKRLFAALSTSHVSIVADSVIFGAGRIPLAGLPPELAIPGDMLLYTRSRQIDIPLSLDFAVRLISECAAISPESHAACVDMVCRCRFELWIWLPYERWFQQINANAMHPLWEAALFSDAQLIGRLARKAVAILDNDSKQALVDLATGLSAELGAGGFRPFWPLQMLHQAAGLVGTTPLECLYWLVIYVTTDAGTYTSELAGLCEQPKILQQFAGVLSKCRGSSSGLLLVARSV
ncbi:MAG: hypothetical protein EBZ60_06735 [Betaproteobacteria bacterium]|nr:hypothetical protein [Betaproteobacteria bacterium]